MSDLSTWQRRPGARRFRAARCESRRAVYYFACTRSRKTIIIMEHVSLRATREFAHCTYLVSVGEVHFYAAHDVSIRKRETRRVCAGWSVQCASDVVGSLEVAEFRVACTTLHYWKDAGDVEIFVRVENKEDDDVTVLRRGTLIASLRLFQRVLPSWRSAAAATTCTGKGTSLHPILSRLRIHQNHRDASTTLTRDGVVRLHLANILVPAHTEMQLDVATTFDIPDNCMLRFWRSDDVEVTDEATPQSSLRIPIVNDTDEVMTWDEAQHVASVVLYEHVVDIVVSLDYYIDDDAAPSCSTRREVLL